MKKNNVRISVGLILLVTTGVYFNKTDKKRTPVSKIKFPCISNTAIDVNSTHWTDIKGLTGKTVFLKTVGNSILCTAVTAINITSRAYFH